MKIWKRIKRIPRALAIALFFFRAAMSDADEKEDEKLRKFAKKLIFNILFAAFAASILIAVIAFAVADTWATLFLSFCSLWALLFGGKWLLEKYLT